LYKAILLRLLKRFDEASFQYKIAKRFTAYEEKKAIIVVMFGYLMLPLSENRRQVCDFTENLLATAKFYKDRYQPIQ